MRLSKTILQMLSVRKKQRAGAGVGSDLSSLSQDSAECTCWRTKHPAAGATCVCDARGPSGGRECGLSGTRPSHGAQRLPARLWGEPQPRAVCREVPGHFPWVESRKPGGALWVRREEATGVL